MPEARTLLLGLLSSGEQYGYEIERMLTGGDLPGWTSLAGGSLYRELGRLAKDGLIWIDRQAARGRPARAVYGITEEGRAELTQALREAWAESGGYGLSQGIAALFANALPRVELLRALQERLNHLERAVAQAEAAIHDRAARHPRPTVRAIHERERLHLESELAWTRDLLRRVTEGEFDLLAPPAAQAPARRPRRPLQTRGIGAFTFVLHSHLPYCRMAGQWPHGEEWLHEAAAETYVPLLNALYDLRDDGVDYRLTVGLTPVLVEQLADADVREHFVVYLDDEIAAAERDIPRFGEQGNAHQEYLATFYRDFYRRVKETFLDRFAGDLVAGFRALQDEGYLEVVTSAATHAYLPLLARDSSIYAQLRTGVESYRRHFGRPPRAIWLPECAYRPAYLDEDGAVRPALEEFLAPLGLTCFFAETHAIEGGRPVGKAAGDVAIGPYTAIVRRYIVPISDSDGPNGTTFRAYYVTGSGRGLTDPPVAVLGRNNRTGQQVWSADWGYPGDADYREFHKKDHETGLQYWRVTGPRVDLGEKDYYHPDWAAHKIGEHARHYVRLVEELAEGFHGERGEYGIVASNYDTELFGHWWFEGINWIREVLRGLSESAKVDLVTATGYVSEHEPAEVIALPESSWGVGGTHWTWDNPDTHWMWAPVHAAERRMEALVALHPEAGGDLRVALNQAAREVLLLESSDWPFLVTTGQAKEYAIGRFRAHVERFERLANLIEAGDVEAARRLADECYELDKVFPEVDYRWFASRQGYAGDAPEVR